MTDMNDTTDVTETVFRQYEQVRRGGATNMVNKSGVRSAASELGLDELVGFIETGDYYELLTNYDEYSERFGGNE